MALTDKSLVDEFLRTRKETAFQGLYQAHMPYLYNIALRLERGNRENADELIQEMWIVALRKLNGFEWRSSLKTWLTAIMINIYKRSLEKRSENMGTDEDMNDVRLDPQFESSFDLEKAISKLPPGYRELVILHDIEGYKHYEIALILNISEGTSKSQLFYARKKLRETLSQ